MYNLDRRSIVVHIVAKFEDSCYTCDIFRHRRADVPSVVRDRVPWEFMPFVLKYCFNKAQIMEGFNQSKIIDPRTKHWYLSKKSDASVDSRQCREG